MIQTTLLKKSLAATLAILTAGSLQAQFAFTNANTSTGLVSAHSGNAVTVVDVNHDGLDDIVRMDQSTTLTVELNSLSGTFTHYNLGVVTTGGARVWGMAAGDVDHNGWKDIATGVNGAMYLCKLSWTGSTIAMAKTTLSGSYFVQSITFGDLDNDGWADLFVCDDNDYSKIYKNNSGTLTITTTMINTAPAAPMTYGGDPADSGNYGSVYTDFDNDGDLDLFVAHCRQASTSSTDLRRKDRMFVNNGSGVYTENAAGYGIEVSNYKQTWTASFGDIDNDGDQDLVVTNHGTTGEVFENTGGGMYVKLTAAGFNTVIDPIESVLEDFDNDGYLDILISGSQWYMWKNNGDKTFTPVTGIIPNLGGLLSFATGDLNHDGFRDIYASYGNIYNSPSAVDEDVLYLNNRNGNHYIVFDLTGTASNRDAIGAKVTITGPFGTQVREVRAGESYGTQNSMQLHFGLGAATSITSAVIDWPSGATTTFGTLAADQFVTVVESTCSITGNVIPGPYYFCAGSSVTLNAASGYSSYLWSNGSTSTSVTASASGSYNVMVTNGACSSVSPTVQVEENPDETPAITVGGTNYCQGTATLTSTPAASYAWTGPGGFSATTQTITPSVSGTYQVTIPGTCQSFTSAPQSISILSAASPSGTGATGPGPASFTLTASGTGTGISWFDAATGGTLLGTGNTYNTPVISTTTTYYAEDQFVYPGPTASGAPKYHTGTNFFSGGTTNGSADFDVLQACTLNTVKLYTDTPGNREIQLKDNTGAVINSLLFNFIADTNIVTLNWALTPGTGYQLTTNATVNNATLGTNSPRLMRSNTGVNYPYSVSSYVNITGSNQGPTVYYYFYDWNITGATTNCTSARTPVTATVTTTTGIEEASGAGFTAYPNPADASVQIVLPSAIQDALVEITDVTGRVLSSQRVRNVSAGQVITIGTEKLTAGSYLLVVNAGSRMVKPLVIAR